MYNEIVANGKSIYCNQGILNKNNKSKKDLIYDHIKDKVIFMLCLAASRHFR